MNILIILERYRRYRHLCFIYFQNGAEWYKTVQNMQFQCNNALLLNYSQFVDLFFSKEILDELLFNVTYINNMLQLLHFVYDSSTRRCNCVPTKYWEKGIFDRLVIKGREWSATQTILFAKCNVCTLHILIYVAH